jgi:hypothetical protein
MSPLPLDGNGRTYGSTDGGRRKDRVINGNDGRDGDKMDGPSVRRNINSDEDGNGNGVSPYTRFP